MSTGSILKEPPPPPPFTEAFICASLRRRLFNKYKGLGMEGALIQMIKEGASSAVEVALDLGANVNAKDEKGQTLLDHARQAGNARIQRLLIERGAENIDGKAVSSSIGRCTESPSRTSRVFCSHHPLKKG